MSDTRTISRHVTIARKSDADGRRIIWGEVMVPIDLEPGGTYPQSAVDRGLHFDGLFMPRVGVMDLAHRGIATRIDVLHNNKPIHADIVESFIARDGADGWTPGAWVAGVQIHGGASYVPGRDTPARDVWDDIDRGTLTGFSIDFRVLVREFGVTITDDHGENPRETHVGEATDPVPIFLSIVPNPAVGRHFQQIARAAVPFQDLELADPETEWNAAAALDRIRQHAGGVDLDPEIYQRAFVWRNDAEPLLLGSYHLPIADVIGDELQAIPRAVFAAAAQLDADTRIPEDDKASIRSGLARYYERSGRPSPWPDAADPVMRNKAGDVSFDRNAQIVTKSTDNGGDMPDPSEQNIEATDDADNAAVIEQATKRGFLAAMAGLFGISRDADETAEQDAAPEQDAADETPDVPAPDVVPDTVERNGPTTFNAALVANETKDDLFSGFWVVMDVLQSIAGDEAIADKSAAMKAAVGDFARWMEGRIEALSIGRTVTAERSIEIAQHFQVDRAKMATKRLERFTSAVAGLDQASEQLRAILTEVSTPTAPRTEDAERSTGDETADVGPDLTALVQVTRELAEERGKQLREITTEADQLRVDLAAMRTELALAKTARPVSRSGAPDDGEAAGNVQPTPKTPHEVLANSGLWNK